MKRIVVLLTIFVSVPVQAQQSCGQQFPGNAESFTVIEDVIVTASRRPCTPPASDKAGRDAELAFTYAHLMTNWMIHRESIFRRLNYRLRPLEGVAGAESLMPASCVALRNLDRQTPSENFLRCASGVASVFKRAAHSTSVSPSLRSYFDFMKRKLSSDRGPSREEMEQWGENYHFDRDGRVQPLTCAERDRGPSRRMLNSFSTMESSFVQAAARAGRTPANAAETIRSSIYESNNGLRSANAQALPDSPAQRASARQAIAEHYYLRHTADLRSIASSECSGDSGPAELVERVRGVFGFDPIVTLTQVDEFETNNDMQAIGEQRLIEDIQMIQRLGGVSMCGRITDLLNRYIAYSTSMAQAARSGASGNELAGMFAQAFQRYADGKRALMGEVYAESGASAVEAVREQISNRYSDECTEVMTSVEATFCAPEASLLDNRLLVNTSLQQFGHHLCGRYPALTADSTRDWPMAYDFASEDRRSANSDAASVCYRNDCGADNMSVEEQIACLQRSATTPNQLDSVYGGTPFFHSLTSGSGFSSFGFQGSSGNRSDRILSKMQTTAVAGEPKDRLSQPANPISRIASAVGGAVQTVGSAALANSKEQHASAPVLPVAPVIASSEDDISALSDRGRREIRRRQKEERHRRRDSEDEYYDERFERLERRADALRRPGARDAIANSTPASAGAPVAPAAPATVRRAPASGVATVGSAGGGSQAFAQVPTAPAIAPAVAEVATSFPYNATAFNDALVEAHAARTAAGQPAGVYLVAGIDVAQDNAMVNLPVPPAEIATVEAFQDYITQNIDRQALARQGSMIVQLGDGGTLWKVEFVDGNVVVNPVAAPQVEVARRYALDVLRGALSSAQESAQ